MQDQLWEDIRQVIFKKIHFIQVSRVCQNLTAEDAGECIYLLENSIFEEILPGNTPADSLRIISVCILTASIFINIWRSHIVFQVREWDQM
jgi:hypothetical protein